MVPPPFDIDSKAGIYNHRPLSEWKRKATFNTEVECKYTISKGCHRFQNGEVARLEGPLCWAQCIATGDPRLKGN
jgi:hypothetical protein